MKKLSILALLVALTACSVQKPNALKVKSSGITSIVRYPHAERYMQGEVILIPVEFKGTYFLEEAIIVKPIRLHSPVIDDELTTEEVADLLETIL